jgi:hypothetical protein
MIAEIATIPADMRDKDNVIDTENLSQGCFIPFKDGRPLHSFQEGKYPTQEVSRYFELT